MQAQSTIKYGTIHYDSLLVSLPQYAQVQQRMEELQKKYEAETTYNEQNFKRLFAEFLQGQKDFPQNILLKRQRDLQEQIEGEAHFIFSGQIVRGTMFFANPSLKKAQLRVPQLVQLSQEKHYDHAA